MKRVIPSRTYSRKSRSNIQPTNNELFSSQNDLLFDSDSSMSDKRIDSWKIPKATPCQGKKDLCDKTTTSRFKLLDLTLSHASLGEQQSEAVPVFNLSSHSSKLHLDQSLVGQMGKTKSTILSLSKEDEVISEHTLTVPNSPYDKQCQSHSAIPSLISQPCDDQHATDTPPSLNPQNSYTYNWVMKYGINEDRTDLSSVSVVENRKSTSSSSNSSSTSSSIEIMRDIGNEQNRFKLDRSATSHLPKEYLDKSGVENISEVDDVLEPQHQTPIVPKPISVKPPNCRPKKILTFSSKKSQGIKPKSSSFLFPENAVDVEDHFPHDISEIPQHSLKDRIVTETGRSQIGLKGNPNTLSAALVIKRHYLVADTDEIEVARKQNKYTPTHASKQRETIRSKQHVASSTVSLKTPANKIKNYSTEDDYETIGDYQTILQDSNEDGRASSPIMEAPSIQMEQPIILPVSPPEIPTTIDLHTIDIQLKEMNHVSHTNTWKDKQIVEGITYVDEVDGVNTCVEDGINFRASTPANKDSYGHPWSTVLSSVNEPSTSTYELIVRPNSRFVKSDEIVASSMNMSDISKAMSKTKEHTTLGAVQNQKCTEIDLGHDVAVKLNKSISKRSGCILQNQASGTVHGWKITSPLLSESHSEHIGMPLDILCHGSITVEQCKIRANVRRKITHMTSRNLMKFRSIAPDVLFQ